MAGKAEVSGRNRSAGIMGRIAVLALATLSGACSSLTEEAGLDFLASSKPSPSDLRPANEGGKPQTELGKATEYWGREYAKNPANSEAAVAYAKNLKALGNKSEAFKTLQQAAQANPDSKEVAGELGRLAFEFDKISLAAQMLEFADDPLRPDWRVVSARGAALAKLGKYSEAVQHLERANALAPDQPSVQNNLALAYAMNGDPVKAETLLRQAVAHDSTNTKAKQNLALVLGLQGKYDEATRVGSTAVAADVARENTNLVRQMVKLEPKASTPFTAPPALASAPAAPAAAKPATVSTAHAAVAAASAPTVPAAPVAFKPAAIDTASAGSWQANVVPSGSWDPTVVSSAQ